MITVAIIPARGGSKSIPKKNIIPVAGKPVIAWTIEQSLRTKSISETYVTTDDNEISKVAAQYGAKVIPRPKEISGDTDTSESALMHALDYLKEQKGIESDVVVFLQCTSPLRKKDDIANAVKLFSRENADSLMSVTILDDLTLWEKEHNNWRSVNFDYRRRGMRHERKKQYVENGSIYIFKPKILREYNNRIGGRLVAYPMEFWQTWEIDTISQVDLVEFYIRKYIMGKYHFTIDANAFELIVLDFDGVLTNNKVLVSDDGSEAVFVSRGDGLAISRLKKWGIPLMILSTEQNNVVRVRANKLDVPFRNAVADKKETLTTYCKERGIVLENVVYVGNDLNDKSAMECVGWPICPDDAHQSIREIAKIVLTRTGGEGIVEELCQIIGKEQH